jgi:hypothetical protein
MGNSNSRYKYCVDDNCQNKYDRHYHKDGNIVLLRRDKKYCPDCGEYTSLFVRLHKFYVEYKVLYKNEHCFSCHETYEQGTEHNCCSKINEKNNNYPVQNIFVYSEKYTPFASE